MPPHMTRPRKRSESRTAQRDEIRKTTHQYRNLSLPKKSTPIHGINTPQKNRANANQRTRAREADRSNRKGTSARKAELYREKIESLLENAAKRAGITRTQFKCRKKAENSGTTKSPRGRGKSDRVKERGVEREQHHQEQWEEHDERQRRKEGANGVREKRAKKNRRKNDKRRKSSTKGGNKREGGKHHKRKRERKIRKKKRNKTAVDEKNKTGQKKRN